MTAKDRPPTSTEPAGHDRSGRDPEIEKTGRGGPVEQGEASGGAMTGETGNLTGRGEESGEFVPGELREMNDPQRRGELTARSRDASAEHRAQVEAQGGHEGPEGEGPGPTELAGRESGYGTGHGLSKDDPAYRIEEDEVTPEPGGRQDQPDRL